MAKYKIGQQVRVIKTPPPFGISEHGLYWDSQMDKYCGKIFTIEDILSEECAYYLAEDDEVFVWLEEWLEAVSSKMKNFLESGDIYSN